MAATVTPAAAQSAGTDLSQSAELSPVESGGSVTFTITLSNTGTVLLTEVTIDSSVATDCSLSGATLPVDSTITRVCTVDNVLEPFTNVVTSSAFAPFFGVTIPGGPTEVDIEVSGYAGDPDPGVAPGSPSYNPPTASSDRTPLRAALTVTALAGMTWMLRRRVVTPQG